MKSDGVLFHAKHAFMPNSLGYCGPDEKGQIQRELEGNRSDEELVQTLQKFEAAYPFLKLIAKSSGREVFDYSVPEAYWIGNGLLDRVPVSDFYSFSHHEIRGRDPEKVREVFRRLDGVAPPHHTFYVMSTYATSAVPDGPNITNQAKRKLAEVVDNCRISWGTVRKVGKDELQVEVRRVDFDDGGLSLARPAVKRVRYNPEVRPFGTVRAGDVVSIHWNYACDVLTTRQARNIARYTDTDIRLTNRLMKSEEGRS
ncbi:MAG TPA: DUF6390 family protein [Nitrososphaerales archaeon]|nr:DUF6390 family protein [Nitrososphaerales archaeon]